MNRIAIVLLGAVLALGCKAAAAPSASPTPPAQGQVPVQVKPAAAAKEYPPVGSKLELTDAQWKEKLTPEQYRVLRDHGTEKAFTGPNWDNHATGTYACAACGAPLFASKAKFESGTGWPSFYAPIESGRVATKADNSWFMKRTEVHCDRCGGHLGHLFDDGPPPTGQRYCMNGTAMTFEPEASR